jgi:phosphatidylinositol alpha-1,6-mannosyltransferase
LDLEGRPWLLTVSRLDERYKGIDTVLRALPLIAAPVPGVRYVVAGDGPLRPYLERLARQLGCRDRVHFLGRVNTEDLVALYRSCTAFVLMSRDRDVDGGAEGFGLVFLEANSFGKPVLGGNSGGIPDAVLDGETGLLADPESIISVSQQAIRLLTDHQLAERLGHQGRERVLRERTWTATADCLKRVVEDALGKAPRAAAPHRVH